MEKFLTNVDDINREILLNIVDDTDLLNTCKSNKYATGIFNDDELNVLQYI